MPAKHDPAKAAKYNFTLALIDLERSQQIASQSVNAASRATTINSTDVNNANIDVIVAEKSIIESQTASQAYLEYIDLTEEDIESSPLHARFITAMNAIRDCRRKVDRLSSALNQQSTSTSTSSHSFRINDALKPERLLASATLAEFRSWQQNFNLYFSSNHMERFPIPEQQGYLNSCIEIKLQQMLSTFIDSNTAINGDNGCLSKLRNIFLQNTPVLTRRYNFFQCDQKPGERFSDWYLRLQLEGQEAELADIKVDDLYVLRLVTGTTDKRLREEFLRQAKPTREELQRIAMAWESASLVEHSLSSNNASVSALSSYKKNRNSNKTSSSSSSHHPQNSTNSLVGKCFGCGRPREAHARDNCPAFNIECHKCGKKGHFQSVCMRGQFRQRSESTSSDQSQQQFNSIQGSKSTPISSSVIRSNSTKVSHNTPLATIEVYPDTGHAFKMPVLPDTGATETLISSDLVKLYAIPVDSSRQPSITAANGSKLRCQGAVDLNLKHINKYTARITAYVTPDLYDELLLSWHSMIQLGMIHSTFPFLPEDQHLVKIRSISDNKSNSSATELSERRVKDSSPRKIRSPPHPTNCNRLSELSFYETRREEMATSSRAQFVQYAKDLPALPISSRVQVQDNVSDPIHIHIRTSTSTRQSKPPVRFK